MILFNKRKPLKIGRATFMEMLFVYINKFLNINEWAYEFLVFVSMFVTIIFV